MHLSPTVAVDFADVVGEDFPPRRPVVAVACAEQVVVWPLSTPPGLPPRGVFFDAATRAGVPPFFYLRLCRAVGTVGGPRVNTGLAQSE